MVMNASRECERSCGASRHSQTPNAFSPLLIVQGLNDPRVPASESAQMVGLLRARGGEVWYLAAKDEGHGFRKKANRDIYLETVSTFLTTILKTKPAPNAPPQ